jgi:dihydrodipicolinate reductase
MKILVIGTGVMSDYVLDSIRNSENICIGRYDKFGNGDFSNFEEINEDFDVIVDFSNHSLTKELLEFAVKNNKNILIATTGHNEEENDLIKQMSEKIAILKATNTSFGVNALNKIVAYATKILKDFDIEVVEKHHNRKLDAPSGTANTLLDVIDQALDKKMNRVYGRHDVKRGEDEIGVHSIRGGSIIGEHEVIFTKGDEIIEIKHTALSRKIFADGAIAALEILVNLKKGMYSINEVI